MAEVTVKQLAEMVGVSVERLMTQMKEAGISGKNEGASVSESERQSLLVHLKRSHGEDAEGSEPTKITLKRKTTSQLKVASGASGKKKTVNVEVRKKRTYVKRDELEDSAPSEEEARRALEAEQAARLEADRLKAEEDAQRKAEEEAKRVAEQNAKRTAEEEAKRKAEQEAAAKREAEENARRQAQDDARRQADELAAKAAARTANAAGAGDTVAAVMLRRAVVTRKKAMPRTHVVVSLVVAMAVTAVVAS